MMTAITARRLLLDEDLTATHQVRFTASQDALLRELTRLSRRPISATIRDVVVAWGTQLINDEAWLADEPPEIDVAALAADLRRLGEIETGLET